MQRRFRKLLKLHERGCKELAILHCVSGYPAPAGDYNLRTLVDMQEKFGLVTGLSDYTTSNLACFGAVALGASILERHFTDSMDRNDPDIVNSMDPEALKELIIGSIELAKMRGGKKEAAKEE
jgi:N-acetylneuraminate synthase